MCASIRRIDYTKFMIGISRLCRHQRILYSKDLIEEVHEVCLRFMKAFWDTIELENFNTKINSESF